MSTDTPTPNPRPEWVTAAAEAIEDAAIPRIGRDLGTLHRDEIVAAGLRAVLPAIRAEVLRLVADELDAIDGEPIRPTAQMWLRHRADDIEWEHAAGRAESTGKGFTVPAAGSDVPAEGSGHPQPAPSAAVRLREIASDPARCREWLRGHGLGNAGPGAVLLAVAADLAERDTDANH